MFTRVLHVVKDKSRSSLLCENLVAFDSVVLDYNQEMVQGYIFQEIQPTQSYHLQGDWIKNRPIRFFYYQWRRLVIVHRHRTLSLRDANWTSSVLTSY